LNRYVQRNDVNYIVIIALCIVIIVCIKPMSMT